MNLDIYLIPYKINRIIALYVIASTIICLEESIDVKPHDLGLDSSFLDVSQKHKQQNTK